jgi:hypothetical protein
MEPLPTSDIPQIYYCPITQELMIDPVIDKDGNSYVFLPFVPNESQVLI